MKTKYGNTYIKNGYYVIKSNEYGFRDCYLHRLIMADALGCGIPSDYHVHHIDGDKLNNDISNLELLSRSEHKSLHEKGIPNSLESKIKVSKALSRTSDYFRVYKKKRKDYKQGFTWVYSYYDDGKRREISSVNIKSLEKKVKAKGLDWRKL